MVSAVPIRWNPSDPPVACGVYGAGFDLADPATAFGVGRLQSARMGSEVCNACSYWLEHAGPLPQAKHPHLSMRSAWYYRGR